MSGAGIIRAGVLVVLLAGCGPRPAPQAEAPPMTPAAPPDLRPHVGQSYTDLVISPDTQRYAVPNLGLTAIEQARFAQAMSLSAPAWIAEGGGEEAFIVVGCRAGACPEAAGILAIDTVTGETYAAVRDRAGRDILLANDRLEALIAATSPADRWDDPSAWDNAAPAPDASTP